MWRYGRPLQGRYDALLEGGRFKEQSMASTLSSHVAGQISEDIFIPNIYVAVGAVVQTVRSTGYDA